MQAQHKQELQGLLDKAGVGEQNIAEFRRYGSARKLYNFNMDNLDAYEIRISNA